MAVAVKFLLLRQAGAAVLRRSRRRDYSSVSSIGVSEITFYTLDARL
jgi:hypothetical protein